jgi:hypothetical protein
MMDSLDQLQRSLTEQEPDFPAQWQETTLQVLRQVSEQLRQRIREADSGYKPPQDAVAEAVWAFRRDGNLNRLRDARYVCFGCSDPVGTTPYRLIEDERRFLQLLDRVDRYRSSPRPFRRCYHGLLHGYFAYDHAGDNATPAGQGNWLRLREYLGLRVNQTRTPGSAEPAWVDAIFRNNDLLTARACQQFGREALGGDSHRFEGVCAELEIADNTWVVREFILAQLNAAGAKTDEAYRQLLPQLLALLERHSLFLGDGLAFLLDRYSRCRPLELDVPLRDFAVQHWGNPWLAVHDKRWGRVADATRQMVAGWLKLKYMRTFFELLAEDGTNDRRRLNFWLRYVDDIGEMHYALGRSAQYNRSPDFQKLRKEMRGLLLTLAHGGVAENNAFIMRIGNYVVVEFGVKGNACFVFDARNGLPFTLAGTVAGDSTELKHESRVARLRHADTTEGSWEHQFARALNQLSRVRPETAVPQPAAPAAPLSRPRVAPRRTASRSTYTFVALTQFAQLHNLHLTDKRHEGSGVWVYVGNADSPVTRQLADWGFEYNSYRHAWGKE